MGKNHNEIFQMTSIKMKKGSVYEELKENGNVESFNNSHLLIRGNNKDSTIKSIETLE